MRFWLFREYCLWQRGQDKLELQRLRILVDAVQAYDSVLEMRAHAQNLKCILLQTWIRRERSISKVTKIPSEMFLIFLGFSLRSAEEGRNEKNTQNKGE